MFCQVHKIFNSSSSSQIIPIIIGDPDKTCEKTKELQNMGYYVLPINPPTVPAGTSRIRVSLCADITFDEVKKVFV